MIHKRDKKKKKKELKCQRQFKVYTVTLNDEVRMIVSISPKFELKHLVLSFFDNIAYS